MASNGWKWYKVTKLPEMAQNCWKWPKVVKSDQNGPQWMEMAEIDQKWMEMVHSVQK